jgi:type II secretory pathway pseudopilin PulG
VTTPHPSPGRFSEQGFALVELLVAAILGLAVIGASVPLFVVGIQGEPKTADRTSQISSARTFAESVARELRQGWSVPTATPSQLSLITYVKRATCSGTAAGPAIPCRVTYTCSADACTRIVANADGTGAGAPVEAIDGLSTPNVFSYLPSSAAPTFIGIHLVLDAESGDDAITIDDGVALRNETPPDAPQL